MALTVPTTFTTGQVATAAQLNSLSGWYAPPRLRLDNTGNLTALTTATLTVITFSNANEIVDSDGMHDGSVNPTRSTIQTPGFWAIDVRVAWGTAVTGTYRSCQLFKNGTFLEAQAASSALMAANVVNGTAKYNFAERFTTIGDYFEIKLAQDTGGGVSPVVVLQAIWRATT